MKKNLATLLVSMVLVLFASCIRTVTPAGILLTLMHFFHI